MKTIQETLEEREKQHGSFAKHAEIEKQLRNIVAVYSAGRLSDVQRIGLDMIMHKISRILNNGHDHADSWHDIAGYATLVEQDMMKLLDE